MTSSNGSQDIKICTIDDIRNDKHKKEYLATRYEWLKKARLEDRKQTRTIESKIYYFKHKIKKITLYATYLSPNLNYVIGINKKGEIHETICLRN